MIGHLLLQQECQRDERRRQQAADSFAAGPTGWHAAWREAMISGEAPLPIQRPAWVTPMTIGVILALVLLFVGAAYVLVGAAYAQPRSGNSSASGIGCNGAKIYDASTSGSTQLVPAGTNGEAIYICGYTILAGGTVNAELDYGTGTACATGTTKIVPAYNLVAQAGISDQSPYWRGLSAPSGTALCIKTSGGVAVQAIVYYAQF